MTPDLFNLAPCGLAVLAPDGVLLEVNHALLDWTGFAPAELIGRNLADLLDGDGAEVFAGVTAALAREKTVDEIFVSFRTGSGSSLPLCCNFASRAGLNGASGTIALAAFHGERRAKAEEELRRGKQAAEQLAALVAQFRRRHRQRRSARPGALGQSRFRRTVPVPARRNCPASASPT